MQTYFKEILHDKYKKLANLKCDLAVVESLAPETPLGADFLDPESGEMKKFTAEYAKKAYEKQIKEVELTIDINKKLIKDAKKTTKQ